MKILITGGCGFVGSNLAIYLKKNLNKCQVFTLDNLSRNGSTINFKRLKKNNIKNFKIDIIDLKKVLKLPKYDIIIDCCAEAAVNDSVYIPNKVFKTNLLGTLNILNKCVKDNSKIIFLSSSRIYSINELRKKINLNYLKVKDLSTHKINEKFSTKSPKSLYGFTKLASEDLIREYNYSHKIKYLINRFGVISGPWQFGYEDQGFVSLWVINHFFKKKLKYIGFNGSGKQLRDVIHIEDVCEIILLQLKNINKIFNKTFNIGGGLKSFISLIDLTKLCQKITGNKIKFKKIKETSIFDIPYFIMDNSKVIKTYNWKPTKNLNHIVKDIYFWIKDNKKLLKKYIKNF